ncbi:hypothetical protein IAI21_11095, partial [Streptococcus pseudopneumoniae]|uniref:hypothetical protein n=1 Tax=Streptococcus pseudopneumoniae TaxID=257758 RepID=UPI0018B0DC80
PATPPGPLTVSNFAAIEQRLNNRALHHCANATVLVAGNAVGSAIFDTAYNLVDATGMASASPVLTLPTSSVPGNWRNAAVV